MTVGIVGDSEVDWEGSMMVLASDWASVNSFVGRTLVGVPGRCAVGVDRKSMMYSMVPFHVLYIVTEGEDNYCIAIAEAHMYQAAVVRRSCYSSSLLHLGHLALL